MLGYFRLLLAFGVLFAHAGLLPPSTSKSMVSAFFIISGYLMGLTLEKNYGDNRLPFYWNRLLRIYPLNILVILLVVFLAPGYTAEKFAHMNEPWNINAIILSCLLYPKYAGMFNMPAWTLSYEVFFYMLAPLVFWRGWQTVGLYAAIGVGLLFFTQPDPSVVLYPFGHHYESVVTKIIVSIFYFALGAIIYLSKDRFRETLARYKTLEIVPFLVGALVLVVTSIYFDDGTFEFLKEPHGIATNLLIAAMTLLLLYVWPEKESRASKYAGDLCYPVYLFHYFVLLMVGSGFLAGVPLLRGIGVGILTLAASALWLLLEHRTFQKLRQHHIRYSASKNPAGPDKT